MTYQDRGLPSVGSQTCTVSEQGVQVERVLLSSDQL